MRHLLLLFAVCLLQIFATIRAEGHYSVIGPGTLHSAHKYNVAVAVYETNTPTKLKVGITGPSYNNTKTVDLQAGDIKNVEFDVPELESGTYNLTAEGVEGLIFKNTTRLNYNDFSPHIKVQTDKGVYKPGDTVNFRVIFLDENLKPTKPRKDAVIWFEDAKRNRIKEYKKFEVVKGVYTDKLQLSEFPVMGNWQLGVLNGGHYNPRAYFKVSKYVLPKYNVVVKATDDISVKDGDMQIVVKSNYTYGKPVNAKTTVIVELGHFYYFYDGNDGKPREDPPVIIKTADMVNGKAKIDLNVKEYESFLPHKTSPAHLSVKATVEEHFTGVKINGTASSTLYPYRYLMECVSYATCSTFTADKPAEVIYQVLYIDRTQLKDTKSVVKLTYTEGIRQNYWWRSETDNADKTPLPLPKIENKKLVFESHMNDTGHVVFNVVLPDLKEYDNFTHYYETELSYADEKRQIYTAYQYREPKNVDQPEPENKEPTEWFDVNPQYEAEKYSNELGKQAIFTVNSSAPLAYFIYNIIGRGNILHSERVELANKPKIYNLTFATTFLMAPHSTLYLYYVDEHGEFHYAETSFQTEVQLQNHIEITAAEQVKPGENVALRIKTPPNSFVGLLAVDQSVLLLRDNNDISPNDFQWRLGSYSTYTPWQGGYSRYPGERAGVVTLTNADYFYNWTSPFAGDEVALRTTPLMDSTGVRGFSASSEGGVFKSSFAAALPPGSQAGAHGVSNDVGVAGGGASAIPVRKDFDETWIFENFNNTDSEEFTWSKKIPDTITSWTLTAFSINADKGLGVTKDKTNIKTFQPFFISIRLPYSVKRGEVINVPALVFNYLTKELDVEVTLENTDGEFDFTEVTNEIINEQRRTKSVTVSANSAAGVSFMLRPKIVGNIMLKFTATSLLAGDAIHKTLKVVPEGITQYANRAYFVNLKDKPEAKESFELALPAEIVPDSQHAEFAVVGDLLGPMLNNLNNLLRLPTGCGEQTMSTMVPNYFVLQYLKNINKLTPALERKIKNNLEVGYQHILSFRHKDGSFSSFGPTKKIEETRNGSTWLTAYIVRSLQQAKEHINVDDKVLIEGLHFLAQRQLENSSFSEQGDFFYSNQRNHLTMTATVMLAFLENETLAAAHQNVVARGLKYLADNVDKADSLHARALATYTLHKASNTDATNAQIKHLKTLAKTDDDRMWWSPEKQKYNPHFWWRWSFSNEVEITSYILLTLLDLETESTESILPIIKWLVAQRNNYGGFSSTQDTVIGLQALIKFTEKSGYEPAVMDIEYNTKGGADKKETVKVNEDNALLMQITDLPSKTTAIDFTAKGKGAALIQISYQYNIVEKEEKPSFSVETIVNRGTPPFKLEMDVCVEYLGDGAASNMAILEVSMPSGYTADMDGFEHIRAVKGVRHTETKKSDSVIVIYFDSLHKNENKCLPIQAFKTFAVAMQKPAPVELYDYYDTSKKATTYYQVESKMCDICEEDEACKKACA